ncbi:MAG: hypothetical protein EON95_08915 [Caulobacteraceae bacterium]|nr:MAG: hypothetical protein EON95_08915 [Caulobacteraceae bacterium]
MIRPPLLILAGAAVLAVAITFWPGEEGNTVAAGLLPASRGPRLAAAGVEEASSAARMTRFAAAGAGPAMLAAEGGEPTTPPPPPAPDATPVLVGVMGRDGALTAYFSSNGMSVRARPGDSVDGWRVAALGRRAARLVKGRRVLTVSLFSARSGPLSPAMAAPERRAATASSSDPGAGVIGPPPPLRPRPAPRVRKPLPPLPAGSKGYWIGPPDSMPPGFTPMPRQN